LRIETCAEIAITTGSEIARLGFAMKAIHENATPAFGEILTLEIESNVNQARRLSPQKNHCSKSDATKM
jgi:hypothetical protein